VILSFFRRDKEEMFPKKPFTRTIHYAILYSIAENGNEDRRFFHRHYGKTEEAIKSKREGVNVNCPKWS